MMVLRLFPKVGWVSRWPLAFVVGVTAGISLITYLQSNALVQIRETLRPFNTFGNVVIAVGVLTGLTYFFFSKEHKGVFGKTAKVGIWFLMITFGASFGYTVMARISLLIGRMHFLLSDWLGLIK